MVATLAFRRIWLGYLNILQAFKKLPLSMCVSVFCAQHLLLERLATASITITPLSYYIYKV